jgi:uncharacterized RDD family membrane protein YckC
MEHELVTARILSEPAPPREGDVAAPRLRYAGFWRRFLAHVVDMNAMLALAAPAWAALSSRTASLLATVPLFAAGAAYSVVMHARWGQTLGKMAARIEVVTVDGRSIGWRQALLRDAVGIGFGIVSTAATLLALWHLPEWSLSLHVRQRVALLRAAVPAWGRTAEMAGAIWFWSELLVLLFTRKRRAVHDFIAGTVVIRKRR